MSRDSKAVLHRIDELLAIEFPNDDIQQRYVAVIEFYQGALILARAVYGDGSPRVDTLMMEAARTAALPQTVPDAKPVPTLRSLSKRGAAHASTSRTAAPG